MLSKPLLLAVAALLTACSDCNRTGCDALNTDANQQGTGISGIVAMSSDVSTDGCTECPLSEATVRVWQTPEPITSAAAASDLLDATPPTVTFAASQRYMANLEPGNYLFCVAANCINAIVSPELTLTINIRLRAQGPTSFFTLNAPTEQPTEDFGFDVGF